MKATYSGRRGFNYLSQQLGQKSHSLGRRTDQENRREAERSLDSRDPLKDASQPVQMEVADAMEPHLKYKPNGYRSGSLFGSPSRSGRAIRVAFDLGITTTLRGSP